ncbi:MAG TPA: pitrilysin family protein [Longimicrobiaceae bacterium]|jgi:zinc protease|nr:pitrilysin family protein [Longimicrobiaceae bacterium]
MTTTTRAAFRRTLAAALALGAAATSAVAQTPLDRSHRPVAPPAAPFRLPTVEMRTLSNGISVAVIQNHQIPVVSVRTVIDAGGLNDPDGKAGLSALVAAMLNEGTTTRNADQLAEAFADLGNPVTPQGFTTITRNLDRSIELLGDMLMHPAFPQVALDRSKANTVANLRRLREQPGFLADHVFNSVVFGASHPFARTPSEQSVGGITREDLVAFHSDWYRPQNVKLVVVGDVTPDVAAQKLERVLGAWPAGGRKASFDVPAPRAAAPTTIYLLDRPNSPQSTVVVGTVGPGRDTPDFYALDAMNTVYGGLSGSRLNSNLREKHAFTYGANSQLVWRRPPQPGTLRSSSDIVAAKTDSALVEWMSELRGIRGARPIAPAELSFAKDNRTAGLPLRFETVSQMAQAVSDLIQNGVPTDFYNTYSERIRSLSGDDLTAAATKYWDPDHAAIVVVGDRKVVEPGLRALHLAPVVVVDENGNPVES